jgi:hypothetical protein
MNRRLIILMIIFLFVIGVRIGFGEEQPSGEVKQQSSGNKSGVPRPPQEVRASTGPRIDVRMHGAKGDGVANDTGAIQAAINRLANGSTICVPKGTDMVETLQVSGRPGLTFIGDGFGSIRPTAQSCRSDCDRSGGTRRADIYGVVKLATFGILAHPGKECGHIYRRYVSGIHR